jgi:DNA polymerase III epsilon subunit-like protein
VRLHINEYVAIDFETANESRDSACEVALVRFRDGEPIERFSSLIHQERFSLFNMALHGITPKLVKSAPRFSEIWGEMKDFISTAPLVAHNAGFDMSVLYRSLKDEPVGTELDFFCTMVLSRQILELTYFGLPGVTEHLNIEYPMEHRAESDAIAAGKVAHQLMVLERVDNLYELAEKFRVRTGKLVEAGLSGSTHISQGRRSSLTLAEKQKIVDEIGSENFYEDPDFSGKRIVFTGALLSMTRREAEVAVMKAGGLPVTSVSAKTNMLVFGYQNPTVLRGKPLSGKRKKADELRESGSDIEVVDEVQFLEMLRDPGQRE